MTRGADMSLPLSLQQPQLLPSFRGLDLGRQALELAQIFHSVGSLLVFVGLRQTLKLVHLLHPAALRRVVDPSLDKESGSLGSKIETK